MSWWEGDFETELMETIKAVDRLDANLDNLAEEEATSQGKAILVRLRKLVAVQGVPEHIKQQLLVMIKEGE
jgi:hypothetical protein